MVFVATCVGSVLYILWMSFVPPGGMPISKETTRLIGPVLSDAQDEESLTEFSVQWRAVIRKSRGLPVDVEPHPWFELQNSGPRFHKVKDYDPDEYEKLAVTPFTEAEAPEYAALIEESQQWCDQVLATEPPPDATTWLEVDPRPLFGSFRLQAMYEVGSGDIDGACESFRFVNRLLRNKQQWVDAPGWVQGCALLDGLRMESLRSALLTTTDTTLGTLAIETTGPTKLARQLSITLDECGRYDSLYWYSESGSLTRRFRNYSAFSRDRIKTNWFAHRVDWREYARFHHAYYDGIVKLIAIEDDAERTAALNQYWSETSNQFGDTPPSSANWLDVAARDATRILQFQLVANSPVLRSDCIVRNHNERRLTRLTVYLVRFKNQHDRFPKSLDELEPMIPDEHKNALRESLTGNRWPYEPTDAGFVVNKDSATLRVEWPARGKEENNSKPQGDSW